MPQTVNGVGTAVCCARGFTQQPGHPSPDTDAMICVVFFYLPIIPLRAVHTHSWRGSSYIEVPIRWSMDLVFWAFLRRWAIGMVCIAIFLGFACGIQMTEKGGPPIGLILSTIVLGALGTGALWFAAQSDRRHREIRALIGGHRLGSSDPAHWTPEIVQNVSVSMELFGTPSDAAAVPVLIEKGDYAKAMFAARLTVAREDPAAGEALTDKILRDPGARAIIDAAPRVSFLGAIG